MSKASGYFDDWHACRKKLCSVGMPEDVQVFVLHAGTAQEVASEPFKIARVNGRIIAGYKAKFLL